MGPALSCRPREHEVVTLSGIQQIHFNYQQNVFCWSIYCCFLSLVQEINFVYPLGPSVVVTVVFALFVLLIYSSKAHCFI